jgi:hypothetical protein
LKSHLILSTLVTTRKRRATAAPVAAAAGWCLVPGFDGAFLSAEWKEALWDKFFMAARRRQRRSVERYNIVKRA